MIARNKQPVRIGSGLNNRACGQNRRKHVRVHVSYRALLRGWTFRPEREANLPCVRGRASKFLEFRIDGLFPNSPSPGRMFRQSDDFATNTQLFWQFCDKGIPHVEITADIDILR